MQRIAIIDYGMGNLHSVASALELVAENTEVVVSAEPEVIRSADRVVFPGVGAIRDCMAEIHRLNIDSLVTELIKTKPVLAICVGMQALMTRSEENNGIDCMDVFQGDVKFFGRKHQDEQGRRLTVPHMGWNEVHQCMPHFMWRDIEQDCRFYFVHSYYVQATNEDWVAARCQYGLSIHAALTSPNLFATQFHPEKSSRAGLQLLKNFSEWDGSC